MTKRRMPPMAPHTPPEDSTKEAVRRANISASKGKSYIVTHPDGHEETIHGLQAFCTQWGLTQSCLALVARGRAHQHKGFVIRFAAGAWPPMPGRPRLPLPWVITHPGGREEAVTGLPAFCKEHGLATGHMTLVAQGKISHHKGYGCRYGDPDIASRYPVRSRRMPKVPVECTVKKVRCEICGKDFETKFKQVKYCPDCREGAALASAKEYAKIRYTKNKERILAYHKAYVAANKASVRAGQRKYYLENKEKLTVYQRKYYREKKKAPSVRRTGGGRYSALIQMVKEAGGAWVAVDPSSISAASVRSAAHVRGIRVETTMQHSYLFERQLIAGGAEDGTR
jgi:hypothetical protein